MLNHNQMNFESQFIRCDYMGSSKKFLNVFELRIAILQGLTNLLILKFKKKIEQKVDAKGSQSKRDLKKSHFDRKKFKTGISAKFE